MGDILVRAPPVLRAESRRGDALHHGGPRAVVPRLYVTGGVRTDAAVLESQASQPTALLHAAPLAAFPRGGRREAAEEERADVKLGINRRVLVTPRVLAVLSRQCSTNGTNVIYFYR